jgi:tRNA threonylcarbamoyladenosine biosynthesis protein TsaE
VTPVLDQTMLDFISHSDAQTRRLGARLGALLRGGEIICLQGELGTGKTYFVQGLGKGLGVTEQIVSPSFTLIREYDSAPGRPKLIHVDLYRLCGDDIPGLGLEEYWMPDRVMAVEWSDRLGSTAPGECLQVALRFVSDTKRGLTFTARGQAYEKLLTAFKESAVASAG